MKTEQLRERCSGCNELLDPLETFTKQRCLNCYERGFETLPDKEKQPDFIKTIN